MSGIITQVAILGYTAYQATEARNDAQDNFALEQREREKGAVASKNKTKYENALARADKARELRQRRAQAVGAAAASQGTSIAEGSQSSQFSGGASIFSATENRFGTYISSINNFGDYISDANISASRYRTAANSALSDASMWDQATSLTSSFMNSAGTYNKIGKYLDGLGER